MPSPRLDAQKASRRPYYRMTRAPVLAKRQRSHPGRVQEAVWNILGHLLITSRCLPLYWTLVGEWPTCLLWSPGEIAVITCNMDSYVCRVQNQWWGCFESIFAWDLLLPPIIFIVSISCFRICIMKTVSESEWCRIHSYRIAALNFDITNQLDS